MPIRKKYIDKSQRTNASEEFFISIHTDMDIEKKIYYWIILLISIIAIISNLLVVKSILVRKYKYLQKTCMLSLAISDILTVVTFCINYLDFLGKPLNLIWSSGEFLCWYNPVGQVLGNLASSLALFVIALDRYHNVIYALDRKWDPALWKCSIATLILWSVCFGISFPMSTFYFHIPLQLPSGECVYMCTGSSTTRGDIEFYYVLVNILFFLPLISMFFWFYYKIAILIWNHRKPISVRNCTRIEEFENSSCTKGTSDLSNGLRAKRTPIQRKNIQMERKIRTFKIVIILIFAFIFCRMPYWLFWLVKLLTSVRGGDQVWRVTLIFTTLNLLNCALNPFLYNFLNQSIYICHKINDFICTTCCCCFSNAEFEDYEKGTPIYEGVMGKVATVQQPKFEKLHPFQQYEKLSRVPKCPKYTSVNRF